MTGRSTTFDNYSSRATAFPLLCFRVDLSFPAIIGPPKDNGIYARSDLVTGPQGHHKPLTSWDQEFESAPLRQRVPISSNSSPESSKSPPPRARLQTCGSGERHRVAGDSRFAARISVGKFGATVWASDGKEWGRTRCKVRGGGLTNLCRPRAPARSKEGAVRCVRSAPSR